MSLSHFTVNVEMLYNALFSHFLNVGLFFFFFFLDISISNAFLSVTFLLKTDHSFAGFYGKKKNPSSVLF